MAHSCKIMIIRHIVLFQVGHTYGGSCWAQCLGPVWYSENIEHIPGMVTPEMAR